MKTTISSAESIALFSETGKSWFDEHAPNQSRPLTWERDESVTKIVVGAPPIGKETKEISVPIPGNLAELYPRLTHLHLWQISNLEQLPDLPSGLKCLDVRGCKSLSPATGSRHFSATA